MNIFQNNCPFLFNKSSSESFRFSLILLVFSFLDVHLLFIFNRYQRELALPSLLLFSITETFGSEGCLNEAQ
jgi:hypothetical protein